jgi:phosphoglycolate phosphatase
MNKALESFGISPCPDNDFNYFAGDGARVLTKRTLKSKGIEDEKLENELYISYKESYDKAPLYKTEVFKNVREVLFALKQKGVLLGVISNKPHSAAVPIVEHFFPGVFDVIQGQCEPFSLKPSAELGLYVSNKLGVLPSETVYLGDTNVDIAFAKAYGAALSVGVLWGFRGCEELKNAGADMIISDMSELLGVF